MHRTHAPHAPHACNATVHDTLHCICTVYAHARHMHGICTAHALHLAVREERGELRVGLTQPRLLGVEVVEVRVRVRVGVRVRVRVRVWGEG